MGAKKIGRKKVRICGIDCNPGSEHCNGYCTGKVDHPESYMDRTVLLEDLLNMTILSEDKDQNPIQVSPEFRVAVQSKSEDGIHIIIHANGHSSETLDYLVKDDKITRLK